MNYLRKLFTEDLIKKVFAVSILIGIIILLTPFKNLLLLTFIFTFLFGKGQNLIYDKVNKKIKINKKILTILIFLFVIGGILFSLYVYIPKLTKELIELKEQILIFINENKYPLLNEYINKLKDIDYANYIGSHSGTAIDIVNVIKNIATDIGMSLILSLVILLEEDSLRHFTHKVLNSKLSYLYRFYKDLGVKFLNSFGLIIELQFISSFLNGVMAVIGLYFLGFPQSIGLGFLIFIASLIPIVGPLIAMIPICLIGLQIGGIGKVIAVIILISLINIIEGYVTRPLLMKKSVKVPTFFIFISLIFGQHFMGTWGLLLGLPIMMFIFEIFDVN